MLFCRGPRRRLIWHGAGGPSAATKGWASVPLTRHPSTADREDLAHKAIGMLAAQVGRELGVFARRDKTSKWHFALQSLLKARVGLNVWGKVSRVVDEGLCDGVYLNVVRSNFNADRLHVRELGASGGAVG